MPSNAATVSIFADEFGSFFGDNRDALREKLRVVKGVPNAKYQVKDAKVFVFEKLVSLIKERTEQAHSASDLAAVALGLLPQSFVSAQEAVEHWGVMPRPYELIERPDHSVVIRHREFDACLPEIYANKQAAQKALASILLGEIQSGGGDFVYRGQSMYLCNSFSIDSVPSLPSMTGLPQTSEKPYKILSKVDYLSGFSPITADLFNQVKDTESQWRDACARIKLRAWSQLNDLWLRAADFELERFNDPADQALELDDASKAQIRALYPELSMLSIGSLYGHLDSYMAHVGYENDWTPVREEAFIVFLLGRLASRTAHPDEVMLMGQWMAGALLRGDTLEDAIKIGRAARDHGQAIVTLASRVASVMNFLARDHSNYAQQGNEVRTFNDVIRMARSSNTVSLTATQKESDFQ